MQTHVVVGHGCHHQCFGTATEYCWWISCPVTPLPIAGMYCETLGKLCLSIKNVPVCRPRESIFTKTNARSHTADLTKGLLPAKEVKGKSSSAPLQSWRRPQRLPHYVPRSEETFWRDEEVQAGVNAWLRDADGKWYEGRVQKSIMRMRKLCGRSSKQMAIA